MWFTSPRAATNGQ
ncbi:hypothetical protein D046_7498A, partial [Vibrio parahaemolyticus V-223/04]